MKNLKLHWLGETPKYCETATFGIPFSKGEVSREDHFALVSGDERLQVQKWPLAYWPDGSVKWLGLAACDLKNRDNIELVKENIEEVDSGIEVIDQEESVMVNNGQLRVIFSKEGNQLMESIHIKDKIICNGGRLIGLIENRTIKGSSAIREEKSFESMLSKVTVEQKGSLRCVIKIEGMHLIEEDQRKCLPFTVRAIIYKGSNQIEWVHNFLFDGQPEVDYIKGIGIEWDVALDGELYNRQVKFAGDTGMFAENCQFISRRTKNYETIYKEQVEGQQIQIPEGEDWLQDMALWQHFKLIQNSHNHYVVQKTAKDHCAYIDALHGNQSKGSAYVFGQSKGFMVSMRDFWQKCPASLEVNDLGTEHVLVKAWFWSPDTAAMDLRHYDTQTHVESSYEGAEELDSTPYGIGNTHELTITLFDEPMSNEDLFNYSVELQRKRLLMAEEDIYRDSGAIGIYSAADTSTPVKAYIEKQLNQVVDFYIEEVEQRTWYGFWNYGDVMHTYDPIRHQWRYDLGGFAWQNTELAPNMWLWYMFLRTQDARIFKLAEAMTRHTSEVDIYHMGDYKGLGSRHNVIHWGCGAKEARIAMAGLHRYYYYLTADERIGDILSEVVDADYATLNKDPMREYYKNDGFKTHARSGPDWAAFTSNWFTQWERFEDESYRDKIITGVDSLYNMPHRMLSGSCFGYDPDSGKLLYMGESTYGYHLAICMGEPEVWMEMAEQLEDDRLKEMLIEFGDFYYLSHEEKKQRTQEDISKDWEWPMFATDIAAYAAKANNNKDLAEKIWHILLKDEKVRCIDLPVESEVVNEPYLVKAYKEIPSVTTNTMSQWCLNVIVCLELIGEYLPEMEAINGEE